MDNPFPINPTTYARYMRLMDIVESRVGLNVKVHGNKDLLHNGQIFLFNHFARFETTLPPYILHKETDSYCRSVAHHGLFGVNEGFRNWLTDMGVVPNNAPNLLPFLAAEILRGRKVVIFPEGGLIKNRKVMNDNGQLGIVSWKTNQFRKLHRGAAALALTLDLFKHRIRSCCSEKDVCRMEHWRSALGLESIEALEAAAAQPTLVVPSTITFYPIRIDDNIITKSLEFFMKRAPSSLLEELAVEGNIIFKDTDMDIRLGEGIQPHTQWPFWKEYLLKNYFEKVDSLTDFFSLQKRATNFSERLLVGAVSKNIDGLRDKYMGELYKGITINLSHLASTLIGEKITCAQEMTLDKNTFHMTLYLAIKYLQKSEGVYLHRSLNVPDRYNRLIEGKSDELSRFLQTCTKAKLLEKGKGTYKLSQKLCKEHSQDEVRLENPIEVYANEAMPVKAVKKAIHKALKNVKKIDEKTLANHLFEDEMMSYTWCREHFNEERFTQGKKSRQADGSPYFLQPKKPHKTGVLLVHGFTASPLELKALGEDLFEEGHPVLGVRLAGHGTSPWDLHRRDWPEWLHSVERGYQILAAHCDQVIVVGFSTGGTLGLMLASQRLQKLKALVSVAAPLAVQDKGMMLVPWVNRLNKLAHSIAGVEGVVPFYEKDPRHPEVNYDTMPVHALNELNTLMTVARQELPEVEVPTLIIQGDEDVVVAPKSADYIHDGIASKQKEIKWIKTKRHDLIYSDIGKARSMVKAFIKKQSVG